MLHKSLRKGTVWTIIFFLASFIKTIILTPLMLLHWGAGGFSEWAIILSARAIILFLSDGFVRYIVNQYNILFHTDEAKANAVLSSGVSFLVILSLALCVGMCILLWLNPYVYGLVFGVEINELFGGFLSRVFGFCLIAYIVAACVQTIQRMYSGTKEARGLVWNNLLVEVVLVAVEILILSCLLLLNVQFAELVLVDSGIVCLIAIVYLFHLWRKYPLQGALRLYSIKGGARYFATATQLYTSNFFEKITTDGLVLLLSFFRFDKAAIALFATVRTIVNTPLLAQNLFLNTYTPEMQKHFSLRNSAALEKLLRFIRLRIGALLCLGILICLPFYEPVFILWTKGEIAYNELFMLLMLIMAVFNLYGLSYAFVLKGVNANMDSLVLMLVKSILLFAGFIWSQQNLMSFGISLVLVELLTSVVFLPVLTHRYFLKQKLDFRLEVSFLGFTPYLITSLILITYLLYNIFFFDFKMTL